MDDRGVASVEYVMGLALVSVGACVALMSVGSSMLRFVHVVRSVLLLPVP
jgi:hypothetical protein